MTTDDIKFFFCYDVKLFDHLSKNGFKYITKAKHYKTNDLFSLFIKTPELAKVIDEWEQKI